MTQQRVESCMLLLASEYLCRAVQFGILEQPSIHFSSSEVMNPIPQTPEDLTFGREDLHAGCQEGVYEEVTTGEAERIRSKGAMISSRVFVWKDGPEGCYGPKPSGLLSTLYRKPALLDSIFLGSVLVHSAALLRFTLPSLHKPRHRHYYGTV
jgi:hypothetical protein